MENDTKTNLERGREAIEKYREDHTKIYEDYNSKTSSEEHTQLLKTLIEKLEEVGYTSDKEDFKSRKTEILHNLSNDYKVFRILESGIEDNPLWKGREDLSIIGNSPGIVIDNEGLKLEMIEMPEGITGHLTQNHEFLSDTSILNHISHSRAVGECPENSRVFILGLGLALPLLYLAQSGKSNEVIICEINKELVKYMKPKLKSWFDSNYPDFKYTLIEGDGYKEILDQGKFDWIFINDDAGIPEEHKEIINNSLTNGGVLTKWGKYNTEI